MKPQPRDWAYALVMVAVIALVLAVSVCCNLPDAEAQPDTGVEHPVRSECIDVCLRLDRAGVIDGEVDACIDICASEMGEAKCFSVEGE